MTVIGLGWGLVFPDQVNLEGINYQLTPIILRLLSFTVTIDRALNSRLVPDYLSSNDGGSALHTQIADII